MHRIHKYYLEAKEEPQSIQLSENAKVVHVGEQYGSVTIWVEENPNEEKTVRTFYVIGTGWDFGSGLKHCGTVVTNIGFVWHIYEN